MKKPVFAADRFAPEGQKWMCLACGREQPRDLYEFKDEACILNAVLVVKENTYVKAPRIET